MTTTFAVTGVTGVPLSFLILAVALALFAVGYAAMSRFVANAGAFYSYLAHGLGPTWAVAGAFVALVSYNAIQIGLYGLFGSALGDLIESNDRGVAAVVGVGRRRADRRRPARRAPRRPQRQRARRAAGAGVHRGGALRHRRVHPPRGTGMSVAAALSAVVAVRAGGRRGLRVRRRRVHRLRVRRDLQRGVPQPAGHGGQGHVRRRRVHRAVLRAVVVGHGRHGRAGGPAEAGHRERARRRVRGPGRALGRRPSPRSPTCCSSPACSPRC